MHVRIEGKASIEEAISAFTEAMNMLSEHEISFVSDMNLYCSIYDEHGDEREVVGANGNNVGIIYKANADPKPIKIQTNRYDKSNPRFKAKAATRSVA